MLSNKIHHFYDSRASIVAVIMGVCTILIYISILAALIYLWWTGAVYATEALIFALIAIFSAPVLVGTAILLISILGLVAIRVMNTGISFKNRVLRKK